MSYEEDKKLHEVDEKMLKGSCNHQWIPSKLYPVYHKMIEVNSKQEPIAEYPCNVVHHYDVGEVKCVNCGEVKKI